MVLEVLLQKTDLSCRKHYALRTGYNVSRPGPKVTQENKQWNRVTDYMTDVTDVVLNVSQKFAHSSVHLSSLLLDYNSSSTPAQSDIPG